ncbi:MAG: hypothetical protein DMG21_04255 [Acidobacteria bacterium]|nr:MAG: hypothetical protein DMG21_04255 [Acidobacteriota bacterium]
MIHLRPETERLLEDEVRKGHFQSVDEMIGMAIHAMREQSKAEPTTAQKRREAVEWALDFAKNKAIPLG